jgi:hypothetical protein
MRRSGIENPVPTLPMYTRMNSQAGQVGGLSPERGAGLAAGFDVALPIGTRAIRAPHLPWPLTL